MTELHPGRWLVDTKMMAEVEATIAAGDARRASALMSDPTVLMTAVEIPFGAEVWEHQRAEAANRELHERFGERFPDLVRQWRRHWGAGQEAMHIATCVLWGLSGLAIGLFGPAVWIIFL